MELAYQLISKTKDLEVAAEKLRCGSTFFIDTEFEQKAGETTLCLIQISDGKEVLLIDALRLSAMQPLASAIAKPGAEWVVHAGRIDVALLLSKLKLAEPPRIFDTQVAWGLLGAEYPVSLAYLNYRLLGIATEKEHQADPWSTRPLPESQLGYAARDVGTLPRLRTRLGEMLGAESKQDLVYTVSTEIGVPREQPEACHRTVSIDDFRNAWELDHGGRAALQFLIDWWNNLAEEERPAGLKPYLLFLIARRMPQSGEELGRIKGVPARWARRHGDLLTGRMVRASYEATEEDYPPIPPRPYVTFNDQRVDAFLSVARYAVSRTVRMAPEICFPAWLLQESLREHLLDGHEPRSSVELLDGWRRDWLAPPYLDFCAAWERLGID